MARWDIAQLNEVVTQHRLDGEYHSHSAKYLDKRLRAGNLEINRIRDCCHRITSGHTPLRHKLIIGDIFFVTVECVSPLLIEYSLTKRVEQHHYSGELNRVALDNNAVVVTIKRRIAQASPCYNLVGETVVNQDVAVLRLRDGWSPGYVAAYLNSCFGQALADRERTEQMNPYLPVNKLGNLLIPKLAEEKQAEIDVIVKRRFQKLSESESAYQQAQRLLETELGLDKLSFKKTIGYTAKFSELEVYRRADAEFYHLKYEPFLDKIRKYRNGYNTLGQLTKHTLPNFEANKHFADFDYVEIGDISISDGSYVKHRINSAALPANAKIKLSGGEIIISLVRPTRGAIAVIEDMPSHEIVCSGGFYVCTSIDHRYREIIWLYLRTIKNVFEKYCGGTSYPTIDSRYLSKFPVPLFDQALAQEIKELIVQSKNAKQESKFLLEQAKTRVEQLIEAAVQA
jgi:hypothetical protein